MTKKSNDLAPAAGENQNQSMQVSGANQASPSVRFTDKVIKELQTDMDNPPQLTNHQKKIIQNAFVKLDMTLKQYEQKRLAKKPDYREPIPYTWDHVNLPKLAQEIAAISAVGLDPLQKNHVHLVPYANKDLQKYDFNPIIGYRGTEIKATKFGLDAPNDVIVELVYSSDIFKAFKKSINRDVESYEFEVTNPFDRGEILGGFYYHLYTDKPQKNKLVIMSIDDILKRKPDYASADFWGGEKDEYKNGQKTGQKIVIDGWFAEMCYKTVFRAAYDSITIDSEKITEHLAKVIQMENDYYYGDQKPDAVSDMKKEVKNNAAAGKTISIDHVQKTPENVDQETGEVFQNDPNDDGLAF